MLIKVCCLFESFVNLLRTGLPDSDNCTETDVRLVGGQSGPGGYIEVCVSGFYTGICGEGFDVRDASVLCSQLGLPSGGCFELGSWEC